MIGVEMGQSGFFFVVLVMRSSKGETVHPPDGPGTGLRAPSGASLLDYCRRLIHGWQVSEFKRSWMVFFFFSSTSSSPVPEITWKRANGVPFPSKVKMKYSNAVLEIPSFQQDDTGGYECVAENRMGKNMATGRLAFYGTKHSHFLQAAKQYFCYGHMSGH